MTWTGTASSPRLGDLGGLSHRPVLRLTRRGRVVVLLGLLTLLLAAFSLGRVGSQASPRSAGPDSAPLVQTVVQPGESLWTVARRIAPQEDTRTIVARLEDLNHLDDSGTVLAGQLLVLPR